MPISRLAFALVLAGITFLLLWLLIGLTKRQCRCHEFRLLALIAGMGLVARLILLGSEPVLEADFNRYLWDGGLTARGWNAFEVAPARVSLLPYDDLRVELSKAASPVFERITYPELKTIYPAVAQAAFAMAHLIEPWSLLAWRLVCLAAETLTLALLVALLRDLGRSPLWSALYWWNPLVLKEIANSAHMEAVLLPLLLAAVFLAARSRTMAATLMLGAAAGTKLWPILLAPLILRPWLAAPRRLAAAVTLLAMMLALLFWPAWRGGIDATSGFVGFARDWSTNSALFPLLERVAAMLVGPGAAAGLIVRVVSGIALACLALGLALAPIVDARDLVRRAFVLVSVLVLLSPAQFPWYLLWVLPFAVLHGGLGWHVAAAVMPLYYLSFDFLARGSYQSHWPWLVAAIWIPAWAALAWDCRRGVFARQS